MKRLSAILLTLLLAITIFAQEFNRSINVAGGAARKLSTVLSDGGYSGAMTLDALTICNPDAATNTLYIGQSDVSASNGFALTAGDCYTWPSGQRPTDAGRIYLFAATSQKAEISLRSNP